MLITQRFYLNRQKMLGFLGVLEAPAAPAASGSVYFPPGLSTQEIAIDLREAAAGDGVPELPELVCASRTGAVVFWSASQKYLVLPPFPVRGHPEPVEGSSALPADKAKLDRTNDSSTTTRLGSSPLRMTFSHLDGAPGRAWMAPGIVVAPLTELLSRNFEVAVVLVRLGAYAIGLCRGEELVASKVGAGNIHGRHKQGGSSSNRFRRHREKQIETFLVRVCGHIQEILRPQAKSIDHIVYGGSNSATLLLRKHCDLLRQFDGRDLPPLFDWQEPRQRILEAAVIRVWSTQVVEWREHPYQATS